MAYPIALVFSGLLVILFIALLITWCCKQYTRGVKEHTVTLIPQQVDPNERYINTIDVMSGLPVVVDLSAIANARNQQRIRAARHATARQAPNTRNDATLYGSIERGPPGLTSSLELPNRTPPPSYTEVINQQPPRR